MSDELTELLERAASRIDVGPPPRTDELRVRLRRRRRRARGDLVAAVLLAAVGIGVTTLAVVPGRGDPTPAPQPVGPVDRYGKGHAFISVPAGWTEDDRGSCGITRGAAAMFRTVLTRCFTFPGGGTTLVTVLSEDAVVAEAGAEEYRATWVDGVSARVSPVSCSRARATPGANETCGAHLVIPSEEVGFSIRSSRGRAEVQKLLGQVHVDRAYTAVPPVPGPDASNNPGPRYVEELRELGFRVEVRTRAWRRGFGAGDVLGVEPAPGTTIAPGHAVVVTLSDAPPGSEGQVWLGLQVDAPDFSSTYLDVDLRGRGARIVVGLGAWFLPLPTGPRADDVTVEVDGDAVGQHPMLSLQALTARRRGTATLRFVLHDRANDTEIGRAVVVVR